MRYQRTKVVLKHEPYGTISISLLLDIGASYTNLCRETIEANLQKIENASAFRFENCKDTPPHERYADHEFSINGVAYKSLCGEIRLSKNTPTTYQCTFDAIGVNPNRPTSRKSLSKPAQAKLEDDLSYRLAKVASKNQRYLITQTKRRYLELLTEKVKHAYEESGKLLGYLSTLPYPSVSMASSGHNSELD